MKKVMDKVVKVTPAMINKVVSDEGTSKSAKMKALFELGMDIKPIAEAVGVRYNFVYNVISNHVTINGIAVEKNVVAGKKDKIIELHVAGKSNKEISVDLKTNYNYVYNVIKKYKTENVVAVGGEE